MTSAPFRQLLRGLAGLSLFWSATAGAEAKLVRPDPETFAYTTPTEKNYVRAVLELESLTTVSVVWYVISVRKGGDVGYRWQTFEHKLTGSSIAFDDNAFGTNFHGHGVGGNAYYLSARGNHLSVPESFGFAVAGAVLWEYFGEISEVVSVNDVIVTPLSGITIGEPFTQLGAFFDRQSPTLLHRVLGSAFGPIKSINDAFDGTTLRRASGPDDEWHRFTLASSTGVVREEISARSRSVQSRDFVAFELSERLARLRNYDGATDRAGWFDDANLSDLSLTVAVGPRGLKDLAFKSDVVPFGYFQRRAQRNSRGLFGSGFVVGFEMGYRYLLHDYGGVPHSSLDRAAFVQPVGALFEYRATLGSVSLTSKLDLAGAFGGIHPIALDAFGPDRSSLASVVQHKSYYFGAGGQVEASLSLGFGQLVADGSLLARHFVRVDPNVTQYIEDDWRRLAAGVGIHIRPAWLLRVYSEDSLRMGRLADARTVAHENAAGLELRANF